MLFDAPTVTAFNAYSNAAYELEADFEYDDKGTTLTMFTLDVWIYSKVEDFESCL